MGKKKVMVHPVRSKTGLAFEEGGSGWNVKGRNSVVDTAAAGEESAAEKKKSFEKEDLYHRYHHDEDRFVINPFWQWRTIWDILVALFVLYIAWKVPYSGSFGALSEHFNDYSCKTKTYDSSYDTSYETDNSTDDNSTTYAADDLSYDDGHRRLLEDDDTQTYSALMSTGRRLLGSDAAAYAEKSTWTKMLCGFDNFLNYFFYIDIALNFNTGFVHDGHLVMKRVEIAKHYLESWFIVDLLASFPWEAALSNIDKNNRKAVKISKVLKLAKLLRFSRIITMMRSNYKYRHVLPFTFSLMFLAHWFTCVWALLDDLEQMVEYHDPAVYGRTEWNVYWQYMNNAISHLLLISSPAERRGLEYNVVSILMTLCGGIVISFIVGSMVHFVKSSDEREQFEYKMTTHRSELSKLDISQNIRTRVSNYYNYLWRTHQGHASNFGANLLSNNNDISAMLRAKVCEELVLDSGIYPLRKLAIMNICSDQVLCNLCEYLCSSVVVFLPSDVVVQKGTIGRALFYVQAGEIVLEKHQARAKRLHLSSIQRGDAAKGARESLTESVFLQRGEFFGERCLVEDTQYPETLVAFTVVECCRITRDQFENALFNCSEFARVRRCLLQVSSRESDNLKCNVDEEHVADHDDDDHSKYLHEKKTDLIKSTDIAGICAEFQQYVEDSRFITEIIVPGVRNTSKIDMEELSGQRLVIIDIEMTTSSELKYVQKPPLQPLQLTIKLPTQSSGGPKLVQGGILETFRNKIKIIHRM